MESHGEITLVTETRYPQINGVSLIVDQLIKRLKDQGWRIQLLSPGYAGDTFYDDGQIEKVSLSSIRFPLYPEIRLPVITPGRVGIRIKAFGPQIMHIFTEGPLGFASLKYARSARLPAVTSYHTNFPTYMKHYRMTWLEPLSWRYLRWFHNSGDATLAPTGDIAGLLASKGFTDVKAWGHGVDTELFNPDRNSPVRRDAMGAAPGDTVFLYVGRVASEKNIQTLIDAFQLLPIKEGIRLMVVGEGPLSKKFASIDDQRIKLLGFQTPEALAQIYASSDVFVFPSLTDTFGLVVLEAMASGLPVVSFDVTGPRTSIIPGNNGLLAESRDARSLAFAMLKLHRDRELRRKLSAGARAHAEANGWDIIMERSISLYEKLSGIKPRVPGNRVS